MNFLKMLKVSYGQINNNVNGYLIANEKGGAKKNPGKIELFILSGNHLIINTLKINVTRVQ